MTPERLEGIGILFVTLVAIGMVIFAFGAIGCDERTVIALIGGG